MRRTNQFMLAPTREQHQILFELADACSALYNAVNYRRRQSFFEGEIDWNYKDIYDAFSPVLGAYIAGQVIRKNSEAWRSFLALKRKKTQRGLPPHIRRVSPPGYWKDRSTGERELRIIIRKDGYRITSRHVEIPLGRELRRRYGIRKLRVRWKGRLGWCGEQGRLEIVYDRVDRRWRCYQNVEVSPPHQPRGNRSAFVDVNIRNLLVALIEGVPKPLIFRARHLLSDWLYWGRCIAEHQSKLAQANGRHSSMRLRRLYRRRQHRLKQGINSIVRAFVKFCWLADVSTIYVDDPLHTHDGVHWHKKGNTLLHNFWCYRYLMQRLRLTAEEYGIRVVARRASSERCSLCGGNRGTTGCYRKHRGLFVCKTHNIAINADVNACLNLAGAILPSPSLQRDRDNWLVTQPVAVSSHTGESPNLPALAVENVNPLWCVAELSKSLLVER
jgi:putative transposase